MKGLKAINEFFKIVHQKYSLRIPNFYTDVDDGLLTFDDIIDEFKKKSRYNTLRNIPLLLEIFREGYFNTDFLTNPFVPYRKSEIINFSESDFKKRNRSFYFFDDNFGYFSFKKTFDEGFLQNSFSHQGAAIYNLHHFISSCIVLKQYDEIKELLDGIEQGKRDMGLLLQKRNQKRDSIFVYSFIYFQFLCNGGIVELDNKLKYDVAATYIPSYLKTNKYNQFFEIFDVMNEVNLTKDIISRFLKVYHILEYLSYRVKLVDIEIKARERRTFIREITSLKSDKEESYIIGCFKTAFDRRIVELRSKLRISNQLKEYIQKQFGVPVSTFNSVEYLPKLIYRLRNSIVHNKESEFHITTSNPEEYQKIIELIKRLVVNLEELFYKSINEAQPEISYRSNVIELF